MILMLVLATVYAFYHTRHTTVVPLPPPVPTTPVDVALQTITVGQIKEYVETLSDLNKFDGRGAGTPGNDAACKYISDIFTSWGYEVELQQFTFGDRQTNNIMASIKGKNDDEVVVVGAHYDGQGPNHPSADDNASGTSVVLAVAKAFTLLNSELNRTVVFQLYSAEEYGLIGSNYYCQHPLFPKGNPDIKKHVFMLNMDMVGYWQRMVRFNLLMPNDPTPDVKTLIENLSKKYPFASTITHRDNAPTDNASFCNAGVPVAYLHTGIHKNYHQPTDTPEKLNYEGLENIAKYVVEFLLAVDQAEKPMQLRSDFVPLEIEKDHGEAPFFQL
jgi:Zn-dependent M28 family amino/carboxypeptidase